MKWINKFRDAFSGLWYFLRHELNAWVYMGFGAAVILAGFLFSITRMEWVAVLLCIGAVFTTEAINSTVEKLCDLYSKKPNRQIKIIKDVAAGAVLIAAIISVVVGIIVFLPYLKEILVSTFP